MIRIDAHQHFWQYNSAEHGWMTNEMSALKRNFLPADLRPLLAESGFDGCVAVQARQNLDETRWLLMLANQFEFIHGVVGWVDLCSPDLARQLEMLADEPKLVGVRHVVQDEPDDDFMLRPDFQHGIAQLAEFDLAYDILIFPRHLRAAAALVERFPQQRFVLDHIAKPGIADGILAPWQEDLRVLAQAPNLCCKLSGMVTEARWNQWKPEDFSPYLDVVFDAFGSDRLMIGSDWPVCTLSANYHFATEIVMDYIQQFPSAAKEGILGANCARIYKIPG